MLVKLNPSMADRIPEAKPMACWSAELRDPALVAAVPSPLAIGGSPDAILPSKVSVAVNLSLLPSIWLWIS